MLKRDTVEEYWNFEQIREVALCAKEESILQFKQLLSRYIGVHNLFFVPSARWGLKWVLSAITKIKGHSGRIMVPAFNCPMVAGAILQSGNIIETYDFASPSGQVNWENLSAQMNQGEPPNALIVSHFFGVPVDFIEIRSICKEAGVYIIEDCAHTLGGLIRGLTAGSLGDASVFSFNYDKPISLGWGGALALNNENLLEAWDDIEELVPTAEYEVCALKCFSEAMKRRREMIGVKASMVNRLLRKLRLFRNTEFLMPRFSIGVVRAHLGKMLLEQYDKVLHQRNANAQKIIKNAIGYRSWHVGPSVQPAWLKQKVQILLKNTTSLVCQDLQKKGYRVGNWNWPILISDKGQHPNSRETAEYWIDVPIHQNLREGEVEEIISHLNRRY